MRKFTPQEDQFILDNYLTMPMKRISKHLGRADSVARQRLKLLGYEVPKEVAQRFALASRRKPGDVPVNKGVPMSEATREKVKRTWFRKGQLPHNTKADGVIVTRNDKTGKPYQYIRIKKAKWELLHRHLWRQHHRRIPRGMIVAFKDGNTMNCVIDNLELITRQENMRRNSVQNLPTELRKAKQLIGVLNRKINKHVKDNQ